MVNEAGQTCDADSGEVWIDPNADREIGQAKEMRVRSGLQNILGCRVSGQVDYSIRDVLRA